MSSRIKLVGLCAGLSLLVWSQGTGVVRAENGHEGMDHSSMGHGAAQAGTVSPGTAIRESKVDGFSLAYRLYSWDERNVMMKGMEGHVMPGMDDTGKSTNHLMVFIKGADGKLVSGGKVGFVVTGPDKTEFKTLTMGMFDGYGADIPFRAKGSYAIRTKAVVGERTITDDFTYAVK